MITASCDCDGLSISEVVAEKAGQILGQAAIELSKNADSSLNQAYLCNNQGNSNQTRQDFENTLETVIENTNSPYHLLRDKHQIALLSPPIKMNFEIQNKMHNNKQVFFRKIALFVYLVQHQMQGSHKHLQGISLVDVYFELG